MSEDASSILDLIQRSGKISRESNQAIMDGAVGAAAASSLQFTSQMLASAILHPGGDIESEEEIGESANP